MSKKRNILIETGKSSGGWDCHMIWCPSQCYYDFTYRGVPYQIYLRWRHQDPWSATLIDTRDDEWYRLPVSFWKDVEHDNLKEESIGMAYEYINKNL